MREKNTTQDQNSSPGEKTKSGQKPLLALPLIVLIRAYQRFISPLFPPRCKYYPSCSAYALGCLEKHGAVKASLLAAWRLIRCNPFSMGGVDYPPEKGKWKAPAYYQMTDQELINHWKNLEAKNIR